MNTKMILEIAGAKPLAEQANTAGNGGKAKAKGLVAEKRPTVVCENFASFTKVAAGKVDAYDSEKVAAVGLGEGMWRGVFGN